MALRDEVLAIRHGVALSRPDHLRYVRISGEDAYAALDRLCPGELRLRSGQMQHSLLLDEEAHPFADLFLGCDEEDFFLLADGPSRDDLAEHLRRHLADFGAVAFEDQTESHGIIGLDGPYAWELLGRVAGPEVVGLPYRTFFHVDQAMCCRIGRSGEYGYVIVAQRDAANALADRITAAGSGMDLGRASLDALDQCALENWFFNIRREGREPVTPIELQLQWRVSYRKSYVGSEALAALRRAGARQRLTCLVSPAPMALGATVLLEDAAVGRVVNAGRSEALEAWVALALIDVAWAHSGIESFRVDGANGAPARSVSPPVLNNRSLYVRPQLHNYATRSGDSFPPLARVWA